MARKHQWLAAIGMFATLCCAGAAEAASQRTFVSGTGSDANPCSLSAPCRSFAGALVNTLPGGEIYVLDTAGYGSVTINQSVSIVNQTSTAGATATSGNAITINAGAGDRIVLRGLTIVGAGTADNGIRFNTGGSLSVEDCSISQFTGNGILFAPTSSAELHASNTRVADNDGGINIDPSISSGSGTMKAVLERVEALNNGSAGIFVFGNTSGQSTSVVATVADSVIADNDSGIFAQSTSGQAPVKIMVRNTVISNNNTGVAVISQPATLFLGHSTLSGNGTALTNSSGTLASYGDNNINGNSSLGDSPSAVAFR